MLLAGYADAEDVLAVHAGLLQGAVGGGGEGVQPFLGVLFTTAIGAADQAVRGGAQAQHLAAGRIEDDGFGALGAAIDAEVEVLLGHEVGAQHYYWVGNTVDVGAGLPAIAVVQSTLQ